MAKDDKILQEIRDRFRESYDAADPDYQAMLEDLRFLNNEDNCQWPDDVKAERKADGRPCLVINKLPAFVDQVEGDIKQQTPSIKVKPVDSEADPETAEKLTGLIRNIENQSMADMVYDNAGGSAIRCGLGRFRITTQYADDDVFEQDIRIKRIKNPFTVYWDPASEEWDHSDARFCFVTEKVARAEFERQYPSAALHEFDGGKDRTLMWGDDKTIRVVEYWKKEPVKKTLYLLRNPVTGETYVRDEAFEGLEVLNTRQVDTNKIVWFKASGHEILEGPTEWAGKYIPIIDVYGKEIHIENRSIHWGVVRHAKDPLRLYNFSRSHDAETTSLAPKSPYLVTPTMIGEFKPFWDQAHKKNFPYLPYNPDQSAPGVKPFREPPIQANAGLLTQIQMADQELHDTTGLQLASLGKQSNEKSGIAIRARQAEGDRGNFAFADHLAKSIQHAGKIILDLIPKIYDTERIVRILGEDGSEELVPLNQPFQDPKTGEQKIYDMTVGKYDVTVSVGPSYQTQREEAAEGMIALFSNLPDPMKTVMADLVVKNLDWPGAAEIEKRLKAMLPPGIADDEKPPMPPQPPDPMQVLEMEKLKAEIEKDLMDVQKTKAEIEKILAESGLTRTERVEKEIGIDAGIYPAQPKAGNNAR